MAVAAWRLEEARREAKALAANERERWLGQGRKTPHSAAHRGLFVVKEPPPLALFDAGVLPWVGTFVHLEPHAQHVLSHRPVEDRSSLHRLAVSSPAEVLGTVAPLLLVMLGYGALCGESSRGTMRLLLATGVSRGELLAGKVLGLVLPGVVLVASAAAPAALLLVVERGAVGERALELVALGLLFSTYVCFVALSAVGVSALVPEPRRALLVLLGGWFSLCVAAPRLAAAAAESRHPAPEALAFATELRRDLARLPLWYERLRAVEERLLRESGAARLDDLATSPQGVALLEEERDQQRVHDAHFDRLYGAWLGQAAVARQASWLAPSLALRAASTGLCGTDVEAHVAFARDAEAHRRQFVRILNEDTARNDVPARRTETGIPGITEKLYQPGREAWEKVPAFRHRPAALPDRLGRVLPPLVALLAWAAAAAAGAAWAVRRTPA